MAEMIQMLDGLALGCGPSRGVAYERSRYSLRLAGLGADPVETVGAPQQVVAPPPSFMERHATQLKVAALLGLGVWWLKIRMDRKAYAEGTRYLKAASKRRRSSSGRTMSGSYRIVDDI